MIISFASSKGGVGKSTTCAAIACALADRGDRVLVLDLDRNQTLLQWAEKLPHEGVAVQAAATDQLGDTIAAAIKSGRFDHILMDLAGFRDLAIMLAFGRSDLVIIPSGASVPDLREAGHMVKDLADVSEAVNRAIPYRLLFTRSSPLASRVGNHVMQKAEQGGFARFNTQMVERAAYKELFLSLVAPTSEKGDHKAGDEVRAILAEIEAIVSSTGKRVVAA